MVDPQSVWVNGAWLAMPTLASIVMVVVSLLSLRRNPPLERELAEKYVKKEDLQKMIDDLWDRINANQKERSDICMKQHADLNDIIRAFERAIGRLEYLATRKEQKNGTHIG